MYALTKSFKLTDFLLLMLKIVAITVILNQEELFQITLIVW